MQTQQTTTSNMRVGWLPDDPSNIERWIQKVQRLAEKNPQPIIKPIEDLKQMVYNDPVLYANVQGMFAEAHRLRKVTTLEWQLEPTTFEDFLELLNAIMNTAPEAFQTGKGDNQQPAGMIGFPINALLVYPISTGFGYDVFANQLFNQQMKRILVHWSKFLVTEQSRYVLIEEDAAHDAIAWLSPVAQKQMIEVARGALGAGENPIAADATFSAIFQSDPTDKYYGFKSWDDFFTRQFKAEVRPVVEPDNDTIINNACESTPLGFVSNVKLSDSFWLKGQAYSMENMLDFDEFAPQFDGGTVYQAFLSALSFHRWHSPVNGTIVKTRIVNGSYYLENLGHSFLSENSKPDLSAPNDSQAFLTAVATRALIFIEADNPAIGLMCVMPVGMAEVSSCEVTVKAGDRIKKGDELGMFHFGGSTHCLIFQPHVKLQFEMYGQEPGLNATHNIRLNTKLAEVVNQ